MIDKCEEKIKFDKTLGYHHGKVLQNETAKINSFYPFKQDANFEKGYDKGHSQEIPKPRVLKPLTR